MQLSDVSILLLLILMDYLTGVLIAILEKRVSSSIGRKGIFNKVGIVICVILCGMIDTMQFAGKTQIMPLVNIFFIVNECFSILENLSKLNVPIPKVLLSTLKNFQENKKSDK